MSFPQSDFNLLKTMEAAIGLGLGRLLVANVLESAPSKRKTEKDGKERILRPATIRIPVHDAVVQVIQNANPEEGILPPLMLLGIVDPEAIERMRSRIIRPSEAGPLPPAGIVHP